MSLREVAPARPLRPLQRHNKEYKFPISHSDAKTVNLEFALLKWKVLILLLFVRFFQVPAPYAHIKIDFLPRVHLEPGFPLLSTDGSLTVLCFDAVTVSITITTGISYNSKTAISLLLD